MNPHQVHQRHLTPAVLPPPPPASGTTESSKSRPRRVKRRAFGATHSSDRSRCMIRNIGYLAVIALFVGTCALVVRLATNIFAPRQQQQSSLGNNNAKPNRIAYPKSRAELEDERNALPFNSIYKVPESMSIVGDRSDRYARLRQEIDALLPDDAARSLSRVQSSFLQHVYTPISMDGHNSDQVATYDIYDCPNEPPPGYPYAWNMIDLLNHWPPDDPTPRSNIHQGLCVFDFHTDYQKAMNYRSKELPFVVVNDPSVAKTVERWNEPGYMEAMLGNEMHRCEFSENNHFMYYVPVSKNRRRRNTEQIPENWKEPTKLIRLPYNEWLQHANVSDDHLGPDQPHWYYRLIGCGLMGNDGSCDRGASEYLYDELPFFQPKESLYIVEPQEQKGIHCRFGMKGVIAENHFDGSRNSIVVLGGSRRYILSHPDQCEFLALYKKGHPSARHSAVDWSHPDVEAFPEFKQAKGNELVLQPGQVLYLPTNWFHFIVSLELNFQCNTRSGVSMDYMAPIKQCGF